jgi:hypothetical protein
MDDYSLVPVEHQPDFEDVSLVPVDHDPFSADGVTQQAQGEQSQSQQAQPQPQQPATGVDRLYISPPPKNPQSSEPTLSTASTPQPSAPTQVGYDGIPQAIPRSEETPNVVTSQQALRGAINQFYPGAQFADLAQQAYKKGQYGNAVGYGVGAVADSLLAAAGGKLLGAGIASLKGIAGSSWALRRALERAGQVRQTGEATHHIVAKLAKPADPARITLKRLGIDINDAVNGVFMPGAEHSHLHNQKYYEAVNKALADSTSKAKAEQILQSIAKRLQSGMFP